MLKIQRNKKQKDQTFKDEMKVRIQIKGSIAESVRKHRLRKEKYKGEDDRPTTSLRDDLS